MDIDILKEQIKEIKENILNLQNKLENIALQGSKRANTITINNIISLHPEWLTSQASLLSRRYIEKGIVGYAEFAKNHSLLDRVKCSDFSRKKLEFIGEDGEIVKDNKGNRICKLFFSSIQNRNDEIVELIKEEILKRVSERAETDILLEMNTDIINISRGVKKVSQGESDTIKDDFVIF